MTELPNVWGTHSCAQFRAIVFDASILVAVESSPAEWEAKLLELGFCLSEGAWYRLGALTPGEFVDLCPSITLVGFDYAFLRGGRPISEVTPVSPILAHELQALWRRNQDAVLLELHWHDVQTVWDASNCLSAAIAGEGTAPAQALRALAAKSLADRGHGYGLPSLTGDAPSSASIGGAKLIGLAGEPLSHLTGLRSDDHVHLIAPLWKSDALVWISCAKEGIESLPVGGLCTAANFTKRLLDRPGIGFSPRDHVNPGVESASRDLLRALSTMHYGAIGVVLRFEYGRLGLFFEDGGGKQYSMEITCEVEDEEDPAALTSAAENLLEVVTRRGLAVRGLAPFLRTVVDGDQGYLASALKGYRSVAIMRSLRESGRGAILSDYEIDQLLAMLIAPVHSLASSTITVASGGERELALGWVEDTALSSAAVRSYLRGEVDELQPTASVVVHFLRSSFVVAGEEREQVQLYCSLQQLVHDAGEHLRGGGFDHEQMSAGIWRLNRIATLPRAQEALNVIWHADQSKLQGWVLAEIVSQLEGVPQLQKLDIQALAHAAADALSGHQGVLISVPIYDEGHEIKRVPWAPCTLIHQRSVALSAQLELARPAIRLRIDALRYADPGYSDMLDSLDAEHMSDIQGCLKGSVWNSSFEQTQEGLSVDRASLWPRAERDDLARSCSGLHRKLILSVWHGLPSVPQSSDRLAVRAYRSLVLGLKKACASSRRTLDRAYCVQIEGWLRGALDQICSDQVVSQYYTTCQLYCSSLPWTPRLPGGDGHGMRRLRLVTENEVTQSERRRTDVLLAVISHEILKDCAESEIEPSAGLHAAADIISRGGDCKPIDWLWAWHVCEAHLLESDDWDLLAVAMDTGRQSGLTAGGVSVREWSAQHFVTWARSSGACPTHIPTTFFRIRRFIERVYALLNLGTPAAITMAIQRLGSK